MRESAFYLEKFVEQEGKPICQHLLCYRLCPARQNAGTQPFVSTCSMARWTALIILL